METKVVVLVVAILLLCIAGAMMWWLKCGRSGNRDGKTTDGRQLDKQSKESTGVQDGKVDAVEYEEMESGGGLSVFAKDLEIREDWRPADVRYWKNTILSQHYKIGTPRGWIAPVAFQLIPEVNANNPLPGWDQDILTPSIINPPVKCLMLNTYAMYSELWNRIIFKLGVATTVLQRDRHMDRVEYNMHANNCDEMHLELLDIHSYYFMPKNEDLQMWYSGFDISWMELGGHSILHQCIKTLANCSVTIFSDNNDNNKNLIGRNIISDAPVNYYQNNGKLYASIGETTVGITSEEDSEFMMLDIEYNKETALGLATEVLNLCENSIIAEADKLEYLKLVGYGEAVGNIIEPNMVCRGHNGYFMWDDYSEASANILDPTSTCVLEYFGLYLDGGIEKSIGKGMSILQELGRNLTLEGTPWKYRIDLSSAVESIVSRLQREREISNVLAKDFAETFLELKGTCRASERETIYSLRKRFANGTLSVVRSLDTINISKALTKYDMNGKWLKILHSWRK